MNALLTRLATAARSRHVRVASKFLIALAVLWSVARALYGYRPALVGRVENLHLGWLFACLGLSVVYRVVNAYGWVLVLRSLGQSMRPAAGVRLWLVSETLRWLPGSVWSFLSRVARAKDAGVPALTASLSLTLELLLTIGAWGITACLGVGLSGTAGLWLARVSGVWFAVCALGLASTVAAAFLLARWTPSAAISRKLRGLTESLRRLRESRPRISLLAGTLLLFTALCFLNGAAFLTVLQATGAKTPNFLATVGINAVGWLLGFFAFFAPAGIGVREGGMTAMLAPSMPVDAAIVGVLLWRLIQITAEFGCLAACFLPTAVSALRRRSARSWAET